MTTYTIWVEIEAHDTDARGTDEYWSATDEIWPRARAAIRDVDAPEALRIAEALTEAAPYHHEAHRRAQEAINALDTADHQEEMGL